MGTKIESIFSYDHFSPHNGARINARLKISEKAVNGSIFIPFHFAEAAANKLTNAALDPVSKIPEYKVCAVKLKKTG